MMRALMLKIVVLVLLFVSHDALASDDGPKIQVKQTGPQVKAIKRTRKVEYIAMRGHNRFERDRVRMDRKLARKSRIQLVQNRAPSGSR